MNRMIDPLLSLEDNLSPDRHEHFLFEHLTCSIERVSVKKRSTVRPSTMASTETDHPGQRYGFMCLKVAIVELRAA